MSIKAIVFDYGKVLTYPQAKKHLDNMADLLGVKHDTLNQAYYHFRDLYDTGKIDGRIYWQKVAAYLGKEITETDTEQLIEEDLNSWFSQNEPVWELVLSLRKNYRTALLSNNIHELVEKLEREIELEKYFELTIFSNRLPFIKPDPRIYHYCLEKLGIEAAEMVFIDDKMENIDSANNLGIKGILFTDEQQLKRDLSIILEE